MVSLYKTVNGGLVLSMKHVGVDPRSAVRRARCKPPDADLSSRNKEIQLSPTITRTMRRGVSARAAHLPLVIGRLLLAGVYVAWIGYQLRNVHIYWQFTAT